MKRVLMIVVLACGLSAGAEEYGYFSRTTISDPWSPSEVVLKSGDMLVILNSDVGGSDKVLSFLCSYPNEAVKTRNIALRRYDYDSDGSDYYYVPENLRTVVGSCNITPAEENSNGYTIDYKIMRASGKSTKPTNVISLPADVNGDMQLVFESSDDLLEWTQEFSFTHNSTNSGAKFFRTRLIQGSE